MSVFCSRRWVAWFDKLTMRAVPQRVQRDPRVELGHLRRGVAGAVELPGRERLDRVAPRKQPALRPGLLPPGAQQRKKMLGEHDIAVLAALALLDPDHHAGAVDVGDLDAALYLRPGAASSRRATSTGLSTTGSRRGPTRTAHGSRRRACAASPNAVRL